LIVRAEVSTEATALIAVGAGLLGAIAAGLFQIGFEARDRHTRRRVAAIVILGDLILAEKAFELVVKRRQWWDRHPFERALETWREHRDDFAAVVQPWDYMAVDVFFGNLERTIALFEPRKMANDSEVGLAETQVKLADRAFQVAWGKIARTDRKKARMLQRLEAMGYRIPTPGETMSETPPAPDPLG
jgi:hypothetical protein